MDTESGNLIQKNNEDNTEKDENNEDNTEKEENKEDNMEELSNAGACGMLLICCLIPIALVGLGISMIVIYTQGTRYYPEMTCPTFPPNLTTFNATADLFNPVHINYKFGAPLDGRFEQMCPSVHHSDDIVDVDVLLNGDQLVARSERRMFSNVAETFIKDCQGTHYMTMRTGDFWESFSNIGRRRISMELRDTNDRRLAYVEGRQFWAEDNIDILDFETSERLANLQRISWDLDFTWNFIIDDPGNPAVSPEILSIIAGTRDTPDLCNRYFMGVAYFLIVVGFCMVCCLMIAIPNCFCDDEEEGEGKDNTDEEQTALENKEEEQGPIVRY